jgi:glycosyltransferase XagB
MTGPRTTTFLRRRVAPGLVLASLVAATLAAWPVSGYLLLLAVVGAMTGIAAITLCWMLHAWRGPQTLEATGFRGSADDEPAEFFSLLLPARHEELVLGHTIDRLTESSHPSFEILVIVGHDDPGTEHVAREAERRHPGVVRVVVDHSVPKNKPKALNTALPEVRGTVVGVFDAEDHVHPALLSRVDARFAESGAQVVQGGVQLMNIQSSWWSLRNCLEYYFWFRSRLHFHAAAEFIPLGGNTVFVRTDVLRRAGGWDAECLAEDCELGVRLSVAGATVAVAYDADVVTREETPPTIRSLVKQRTRWSQGFLQVYRKGLWRALPTRRQRMLARYTLATPFLQAASGVLIPASVVLAVLGTLPVALALLTFIPLLPLLVTISAELVALDDFARLYGLRVRFRDVLRLILGSVPYQVLLGFAAIRAVVREATGDASWEKTEHQGAHLVGLPSAQAVPETVLAAVPARGASDEQAAS